MLLNSYDQVAYRTYPRRQTHPNRLAAVATLFGMTPAAVDGCRVLEIGCGSGGNLIPLAFHLPESQFTGIDLAAKPIAAARRAARSLNLGNLDLRVADLRELAHGPADFDYIFAHGLYSWVPAEVRDALLALCRERLAPQGVAFVSYNAYPGRYPRRMLREILLRHTRAIQDPAKMLAEARQLLAQLPHEEAASLLEQDDDILFHDDLAPINHPVWFHEFAAHAARHKLQYLGEADPHEMFDPREIPASTLLDREQYLDFLKLRRFRQTLLCRSEVRLTHNANATDMDRFLFSANPHGRRLPGEDRAVEAVVQAIDDAAPLPLEFDDLVPYAGSPAALREILFSLTISGCVDLNVYAFPCQEEVTTRPRASRLARYQAVESSIVTNACHIPVQLDPAAHKLLLRLDGSRTRSTLARHRGTLSWLARMALLE